MFDKGQEQMPYYHIHFSPQALLWPSQANDCIHTFQDTKKLRADYIRRMTATINQNILTSSLFTNVKIKIYITKMLSAVSYGCKTLPQITRKTRNGVFQNRALRTLARKREEATAGFRKLLAKS
jgi:hypothetical protein